VSYGIYDGWTAIALMTLLWLGERRYYGSMNVIHPPFRILSCQVAELNIKMRMLPACYFKFMPNPGCSKWPEKPEFSLTTVTILA
jgi:hypothetical protein